MYSPFIKVCNVVPALLKGYVSPCIQVESIWFSVGHLPHGPRLLCLFQLSLVFKTSGCYNFSLHLRFPFQWVDVFCEEAFLKAGVSLK